VRGECQANTPVIVKTTIGEIVVVVDPKGHTRFEKLLHVSGNKVTQVYADTVRDEAGLEVQCPTEGARVSINGKDGGTVPAFFPAVPFGDYVVRVEADGLAPFEEVVSLDGPVVKRVVAMLEGSFGGLRVDTAPSSATVLLDGARKGTTPLGLSSIPTGAHVVYLTSPPYADEIRQVVVKADEVTKIDVRMDYPGGEVLIKVKAPEARIDVMGVNMGQEELHIENLSPGRYPIRISAPGYETVLDEIAIQPAEMFKRTYRLKKAGR